MRRLWWQVVVMLFLANVITYLDRSTLSVAAPLVQHDLSLDAAQLGFVFSAFFVGYALFNFVGGLLADRVGGWTVFAEGWVPEAARHPGFEAAVALGGLATHGVRGVLARMGAAAGGGELG